MTMLVQTILMVPLIPHGVLQLGSVDLVSHGLDHFLEVLYTFDHSNLSSFFGGVNGFTSMPSYNLRGI